MTATATMSFAPRRACARRRLNQKPAGQTRGAGAPGARPLSLLPTSAVVVVPVVVERYGRPERLTRAEAVVVVLVVARHRERRSACLLGGVHLDVAVPRNAGTCRDELADDHVLLEPDERVTARRDRGVGEHPGRLLERCRRQPRLGGQRRLGDAHDLRAALGGTLALLHHAAVGVTEHL